MCKEYINVQSGEKLDWHRISQLKDNMMLKVNPHFWCTWDTIKNAELGLDVWELTFGSSKKSWWICLKCNSSYDSQPQARNKGRGCPYCAGKRVNETNSLASKYPDLIMQWDFNKNESNTPYNVSYGSEKTYWWYCSLCDISYKSVVRNKVFSQGCPYCSGHRTSDKNSLASINPSLALEWHPTKNGDLTPSQFTPNSHQKVWWLGKCGHEWDSLIKSRNKGSDCPFCTKHNPKLLLGFNDMWSTNPKLASLLANPEDGYKYMQFSHTRLDWKCSDCNRIIKNKKVSDINHDGLSCQYCGDGKSYPEKIMIAILNNLHIDFLCDSPFDWSKGKRYDFYLPSLNIIIEMHGGQHYNGGFSKAGGKSLKEEQENDKHKYELAKQNNIKDYIIVDCRESDLTLIKNNLLDSTLSNYLDFTTINWNEVALFATTSLVKTVSEHWNSGINNTEKISFSVGISRASVIGYLKRASEIGLCDYCPQVEFSKVYKSISKSIVGINSENEIIVKYNTLKEACKELKITHPRIKKLYESRAIYNDLTWMLFDEYLSAFEIKTK